MSLAAQQTFNPWPEARPAQTWPVGHGLNEGVQVLSRSLVQTLFP
jgi:hypothetical protein